MNRGVATTRLLEHLLAMPKNTKFYGMEIISDTGLSQGTVYPVLNRMHGFGWLAADEPTTARSRPRRYWWAPGGREAARALLDKPRRRELAA